MDRETAVYHFYLRKKNTDLFRKQKTKDKEWTNRHQSTTPTSESRRQTKDNGWRLRTRSGQRYGSLPLLLKKAEDTRQGVNRPTAVYHSYLRRQKTQDNESTDQQQSTKESRRQRPKGMKWSDKQQSTTPNSESKRQTYFRKQKPD